jgi:hypothetical protein
MIVHPQIQNSHAVLRFYRMTHTAASSYSIYTIEDSDREGIGRRVALVSGTRTSMPEGAKAQTFGDRRDRALGTSLAVPGVSHRSLDSKRSLDRLTHMPLSTHSDPDELAYIPTLPHVGLGVSRTSPLILWLRTVRGGGEDRTMTTYSGTKEFEGATFVKTSFKGAALRFSDVRGVTMRSVDVDGLDIDSHDLFFGSLFVNGVDVVPLVDAELNRQFPGRELQKAQTPEGLRDG